MAHNLRCLSCASLNLELWTKAKDLEYFTSDDEFTYYRCQSCASLFIDPVPKERLNEIYPSNYYSFLPLTNNLVNRVKDKLDERIFRNILKKLAGTNLKVLDVGGGAGWQLSKLKALDARIGLTQIVDLGQDAARTAREKGHAYDGGGIENFKTTERFDLVLLLNLIEHVDNPLSILKKVQWLLSPQGVVLVKTPNVDSLDARIFRHRNWGGLHCPRHWVLFNKDSFAQLARQAQLRVIKFKYTQGAPFWTTSVLAWLKKRKMVNMSKDRPAFKHPCFPFLNASFAAIDFIRCPVSKTSQMFFILGQRKS